MHDNILFLHDNIHISYDNFHAVSNGSSPARAATKASPDAAAHTATLRSADRAGGMNYAVAFPDFLPFEILYLLHKYIGRSPPQLAFAVLLRTTLWFTLLKGGAPVGYARNGAPSGIRPNWNDADVGVNCRLLEDVAVMMWTPSVP
jgi:hypothetical protein